MPAFTLAIVTVIVYSQFRTLFNITYMSEGQTRAFVSLSSMFAAVTPTLELGWGRATSQSKANVGFSNAANDTSMHYRIFCNFPVPRLEMSMSLTMPCEV